MSDKPLAPNCSRPFRAQQAIAQVSWLLLLRGLVHPRNPLSGKQRGKGRLDRYRSPPPHTHWPLFSSRSSPVPGHVPTAPPARQSHSPAPPGGRAPSVRVYARRGLGLGLGWMPLGLVGIFCCCCLDLNIFFCFVFCFVIFFVFLFLPFMVREGDGGRFHYNRNRNEGLRFLRGGCSMRGHHACGLGSDLKPHLPLHLP